MQKTPPTLPSSMRTGSYETSKYVSSRNPWRWRRKGWSFAQNASPVLTTPSKSGPRTCPHLAPALAGGTTERPGMLRAEHRRVGVVVDRDELRAPEEDHLSPGWQQDADRTPEALRPRLHGAKRGRRPVVLANAAAHLAAAREEVRPGGASSRGGPTPTDSAALCGPRAVTLSGHRGIALRKRWYGTPAWLSGSIHRMRAGGNDRLAGRHGRDDRA